MWIRYKLDKWHIYVYFYANIKSSKISGFVRGQLRTLTPIMSTFVNVILELVMGIRCNLNSFMK